MLTLKPFRSLQDWKLHNSLLSVARPSTDAVFLLNSQYIDKLILNYSFVRVWTHNRVRLVHVSVLYADVEQSVNGNEQCSLEFALDFCFVFNFQHAQMEYLLFYLFVTLDKQTFCSFCGIFKYRTTCVFRKIC